MPLDVNDLVAFYASPLGDVTRRLIGRVLRSRWDDCRGLSILGLGFAGPLLDRFRDQAQRTLALMPAEVGVETDGSPAVAETEVDTGVGRLAGVVPLRGVVGFSHEADKSARQASRSSAKSSAVE